LDEKEDSGPLSLEDRMRRVDEKAELEKNYAFRGNLSETKRWRPCG